MEAARHAKELLLAEVERLSAARAKSKKGKKKKKNVGVGDTGAARLNEEMLTAATDTTAIAATTALAIVTMPQASPFPSPPEPTISAAIHPRITRRQLSECDAVTITFGAPAGISHNNVGGRNSASDKYALIDKVGTFDGQHYNLKLTSALANGDDPNCKSDAEGGAEAPCSIAINSASGTIHPVTFSFEFDSGDPVTLPLYSFSSPQSPPSPPTPPPTPPPPSSSSPPPPPADCSTFTTKKKCKQRESCRWKKKKCVARPSPPPPSVSSPPPPPPSPEDCSTFTTKKKCKQRESCRWKKKKCVARPSPPPPSASPSPSPPSAISLPPPPVPACHPLGVCSGNDSRCGHFSGGAGCSSSHSCTEDQCLGCRDNCDCIWSGPTTPEECGTPPPSPEDCSIFTTKKKCKQREACRWKKKKCRGAD
ncbi:hypothetical protein EMIHUDRAFT_97429 [Emiliania huxleyi CCMP1516]|uniref:Uncharacterized protein n=2 Tax=Emiliania huxleyi TaxID=2903 RepID=A0A0D3KZJ4_EMIH1|nr:hypothetical protein EMIHUDRAFT_97429 [Emiliania huxleyi CCMP1516]EOD41179.1 hypothetical protein EMIHUDRAFT_97429 [Emiliania huxleyi CCMP1516]|eukprot:XP_005793608.1 hypothetical protein EMIHUDRAFT_97429 [Emiliania huxleyi CCMP1516]